MDENYEDHDDDLSLVDSQDGMNSARNSHRDMENVGAISGLPTSSGRGGRPAVGSFRAFITAAAIAEFTGTFFLVFLGASALYAANLVGADALSTGSLLLVALCYGFAYGSLVYCFSLNGGGYVPSIRQMNPALTMSLFLLGKIDAVKAGILCLAQIAGAIVSTGFLYLCFNSVSLRTYELVDGTNFWQMLFMSIFVSFLSTFVLVITNFAVAQPVLQQSVSTDSSEQAPQSVHELNSIIAALVSVVGAAVGTPVSGCYMNPLYALTILSLSHWANNIIVVVLGPIFGSLLATLVAKLFTYRTRAPFLTSVRFGQGGLGGLGLGNLPPSGSQQMNPLNNSASARSNPFAPSEEKQGSRF